MSETKENDGKNYSHLYTYSGANKAGMDGIDKEKQAKIIYEMSKDSAYFKRAAKLDAETDIKVQTMKRVLSEFKGMVKKQKCDAVEQFSLALESKRNFDRICCVLDMDMFFAAVEIRDQPHLKDLPVAVGGMSMISTANYVARKFGVRAAMPGFIARKLCPQLVFVGSNFEKYRFISGQIQDIIREYDPHFSSHSLDEVYFDLTRAARAVWCGQNGFQQYADQSDPSITDAQLSTESMPIKESEKINPTNDTASATSGHVDHPTYSYLINTYAWAQHTAWAQVPPEQQPGIAALRAIATTLLQEIRARITTVTQGLTCSAGMANNFFLAKICADMNKPDGQYELPPTREEVLRFVSALPTRKVGGIGKVTERMLERLLEIHTMQQVRDHLPELMHACTPVLFQFLHRACLGIGSEEGCGDPTGAIGESGNAGTDKKKKEQPYLRKSLGCERTYSARGISEASDLHARLREICASVGEDMASEGLHARAVTLKLKNVDFELTTRIATSPSFFQSAEAIEALARPMLDEALPMKVRLMGVSVSKFRHAELASEAVDPKQRGILSFLKGASTVDAGAILEPAVDHSHAASCDAHEWSESENEKKKTGFSDVAGGDGECGLCCHAELDPAISPITHIVDAKRKRTGGETAVNVHQASASSTPTRLVDATSSVAPAASYECPVCAQPVWGSLHAFNRHLDGCLGVASASNSRRSAPATTTAMEKGKGKEAKRKADYRGQTDKRVKGGSTSNNSGGSSSSSSRSKGAPLVLGITDYFVVQP